MPGINVTEINGLQIPYSCRGLESVNWVGGEEEGGKEAGGRRTGKADLRWQLWEFKDRWSGELIVFLHKKS